MVIRTVTGDQVFQELVSRLRERGGVCAAEGLWGSSAPIIPALLAKQLNRPHLFVTAHLEQADEARDDMEIVGAAVEIFPAFETLPGEGSASGDITGERLRMCN